MINDIKFIKERKLMKDDQQITLREYEKRITFFDPYKKQNKLFFRGQLTKYENMNPTIARNKENLNKEHQFFEQYQKKDKSDFQNLAYQQHNGGLTRILDMTTDPLVALFFAVNNNERADSSVFVFIRENVSADSLEAKLMSFIPTVSSREVSVIVDQFNEKYNCSLTVERATNILSHDLFITPNTLIDNDNERMKEQKGTFAFPANEIKNNKIVGIKDFRDIKSYQEIIIPFEYQEKIFSELKERNYSSDRLYKDPTKDRTVPDLKDVSKATIVNFHKVTSAYKKENGTIFTHTLLKKKELEKLGYQIAKERNDEMLTLWFRRKGAPRGVNILTQFWSQGNGKRWWNTGKNVDQFILQEDWSDSFYIYQLVLTDSDKVNSKVLPQSKNAVEVILDVKLLRGKLHIKTNLYAGARLFITGEGYSKTIITQENCDDYYLPIDPSVNRMEGQVTLATPSLQPKAFLEKAGIDFENLKGDFIKRDNNMLSLISGIKEFDCKIKNDS